MQNKTFERSSKVLTILLALCFVLSVTVASVSAATFEHRDKFNNHGDQSGQGYRDGYSKGSSDGRKDCSQHGSKEVLKKVPTPSDNDQSYIKGFIRGYFTGYNEQRYSCLKKK